MAHWHPSTCGHDVISGYEVHSYDTTRVEPTYDADGYVKKTCVVCGYSFTQEILPQLVHNFSEDYEYDETKHWHPCVDAGYEDIRGDEENHLFGDWIVDVEPLMDVEGKAHRVCSLCGYSEEKTIDALPHVHDVKVWVYSDLIVPSGELDSLFTTSRHGVCDLCDEDVVEEIQFANEDGVVMDKASYLSAVDLSQANFYDYWLVYNAASWMDPSDIMSGPKQSSSAFVFCPDLTTARGIEAKRAEYVYDEARINALLAGVRQLSIKGLVVPGETKPRYFLIGAYRYDGKESYVAAVNSYGVMSYLQYRLDKSYTIYGQKFEYPNMAITMCYSFRTANEYNAMIAALAESGTEYGEFRDVTFSSEYDHDETNHWHNANNLSYGNVRDGVEAHSYDTEVIEPTFETEGYTIYTCNVCGYSYIGDRVDPLAHNYSSDYQHDEHHHWRPCIDEGYETTESIDYAAHNYGDWVVDVEPQMDVEGSKHRICQTCGYREDGVIDALPHVHSFSNEWSADETHHWHQATCVHITEKSDYAEHDYDEGVITPPTLTQGGYTTYTCQTCGYHYIDENSRTAPLYESQSADFTYSLDTYMETTTVRITAYNGTADIVYVPRTIEGYPVTMVNQTVFKSNGTVKEIYFPDSVTGFDFGYGLSNAISLEAIHLSDDHPNYKVVNGAVYNKAGTKLVFIPHMTDGEFTVPEGVTGVDYFSAKNAITSLHLPSTWSYEYTSFLDNFPKLASITVADGSTAFKSVDNVLYNPDMTEILYIPMSITGNLVVPSTVTTIGFRGRNFASIDLSATSITAIPSYAFENCLQLTEVKLPNTLISIGYGAFKNCKKLTSLTIPEGVTSLGGYTFSGCAALLEVNLPSTLETMPSTVFDGCTKMERVNINPANTHFQTYTGVIYDGDMNIVFVPRGLSGDVTIPAGVTSIGTYFASCENITSLTIGKDVTGITRNSLPNTGSFYKASITRVDIHEDNPYFKSVDGCVYDKDVTTLIYVPAAKMGVYRMPDTVTSIGSSNVFNYLTGLYMIVLNDQIKGLNNASFSSSSYLKRIVNPGPSSITGGGSYSFTVYTSEEQITDVVDENGFVYEDGTKVKLLGYMGTATDIVIPEGVVTINDEAFFGLPITSLTLSSTVVWIAGRICQNCTNLSSVTLNTSLRRIWEYAFRGCTKLTSIEFGPNLSVIASDAFSNSGLTELVVPATVTSVYSNAFAGCKDLVSVVFVPAITVPDNPMINNILGSRVFDGCVSLTSLTFGEQIERSIGKYFLYDCASLTEITYLGTIDQWQNFAGADWNYGSSVTVVHCSNGDVIVG